MRAEKQTPAKKAVKKNAVSAKEFSAVQKSASFSKANTVKPEAPVFRAPKAVAEAVDVTCNAWDIDDWGEDGELYLYSEDRTINFYFDLIYGGEATDLQLGKTYTAADLYIEEATGEQYGAVFYDDGDGADWHWGIKELSLVKTIDNDGLVHFVGSCTDSQDASFTFHYDEVPFVPTGEEVEHTFAYSASLKYSTLFEDWTIKADDGVYAFQLDIYSENSESAAGVYDSQNEDFDLDYTYVEVYDGNGDSEIFYAHSAKATITEQNDSILINAEILAENGVLYKFEAFYAAPTKQGEATIEATNLVINDSWYAYFGMAFAEASNEDYEVSLSLYDVEGTLTAGEGFSGSINDVEIYSGSITIGATADGPSITGKVLCFDNIEYTLNLTYVLPDKTREETIDITDGLLVIYPEDGDWQVRGFNADSTRYVSIDIISDAVAGTFTEEDMDSYYTYVGNVVEGEEGLELSEQFNPLALNITVTFNAADSTATITGTYLGQGYSDDTDVPEFTLNISAKVVTYVPSTEIEYDAEEDFVRHFAEYEVDDQYLSDYGVLFVSAENEEDEFINIQVNLPEGAEGLVAGEYEVSDSEYIVPGTITVGSFEGNSLYGSYAGSYDAEGYINVPLWFFASGKVTISESLVLEVQALNSKGYKISCRLGEYPEAIDNTEAKAAATKRVVNGNLIIEKNGVKYNAQGAVVK